MKKNRNRTMDVTHLLTLLAENGITLTSANNATTKKRKQTRVVESDGDEDDEDEDTTPRRRRKTVNLKRGKVNEFLASRMAWHKEKAEEFANDNPELLPALKKIIKAYPTGDDLPNANDKQVAKWDRAIRYKSWHTIFNMAQIRPALAKYLRGIEVEV